MADHPSADLSDVADEDYNIILREFMMNFTDTNQIKCLFSVLRDVLPTMTIGNGNHEMRTFCNRTWDGIMCWPTTPANSTSVLPCFDEFNGIKYDTSRKYFFPLLPQFLRSYGF